MDNGLRTFRPDLDHYIYGDEQVEIVVKNWITQVKAGTASRSVLFSGPPGTGKTTLAEALSKKLNVSTKDITAVNCGSTGTLEAARDLLEGLQFAPIKGDFRALILDEVHKMGTRAQEAFLTPLEKLPKHVLVFACTSKPENLDKAFRQRFYEIQLQRYSDVKIGQILDGLPVPVSPEVRAQAIASSKGTPRVAIDFVEKLSSTAIPEEAQKLLDLEKLKTTLPEKLMEGIARQQWALVYLLAGYIDDENKAEIFTKLMKHLDNIALTKLNQIVVMNPEETAIVKSFSQYILVNYWYPQFSRMVSDHPRALRAFITQFMQI